MEGVPTAQFRCSDKVVTFRLENHCCYYTKKPRLETHPKLFSFLFKIPAEKPSVGEEQRSLQGRVPAGHAHWSMGCFFLGQPRRRPVHLQPKLGPVHHTHRCKVGKTGLKPVSKIRKVKYEVKYGGSCRPEWARVTGPIPLGAQLCPQAVQNTTVSHVCYPLATTRAHLPGESLLCINNSVFQIKPLHTMPS